MSWLSNAWDTITSKASDVYDSITSKNIAYGSSLLEKGGKIVQNFLLSDAGMALGAELGPEFFAAAEGAAISAEEVGKYGQQGAKYLEQFETPKEKPSIQKMAPKQQTNYQPYKQQAPMAMAQSQPTVQLWGGLQTSRLQSPEPTMRTTKNPQTRETVQAGGVSRVQQLKRGIARHRF